MTGDKPNVFGREPVLWLSLIQALIALGTGFGLPLTGEQMGLIMAASAAALGFVARSQVTPNITVEDDAAIVRRLERRIAALETEARDAGRH